MTKFTKGPWRVGTYKGILNGEVHEALSVWPSDAIHGQSGRHVCLVGPLNVLDDIDVANAILIAQAPDMYAALEDVRDLLRAQGESFLVEKIEAILKLARGEGPKGDL